jgi:hypothetical protein
MPMSLNGATLRREVLWMLIGLPIGVLLLPPLIGLVGSRVFGAYAGGGTRDLVDHFFQGLGHGEQAFWIVALGPYLAILTVRLTAAAVRAALRPPAEDA